MQRSQAGKRGRKSRNRNQKNSDFDGIDRDSRVESKAPTKQWGALARKDTLLRVPLFNQSSRRVRLPYYDSFNRGGAAGILTNYFFTANGLFDPNITGTGHQPMGFDDMMRYYEQYTVVRSKIQVMCENAAADAFRFGVALTPDTTLPVVGENVENGQMVMTYCDAAGYNVGVGTSGRIKELNLSCDVQKYFGRRDERSLLDDTSLAGTAAANPSEQVYYSIQTWSYGGKAVTTASYCDVLIWYDVIFWEPRKLVQQ
jgi:hypothetical protein